VDVLLEGRGHDLLDGSVVTEMYHLGAGPLEDPAHDVDGGVMAVEEAGGGDEADAQPGRVRLRDGTQLGDGGLGHGALLAAGNQNPK
jgi:hypothetical protein